VSDKEREHCQEVASEHSTDGCGHSAGRVKLGYWDFVALLARERADARKQALAEMQAALKGLTP
jgi:hypothetical protein